MSLDDDIGRVRVALARIADPTEREQTIEAFNRIMWKIHEMKTRIRSAQASLADIREDLKAQMEYWKPTRDEP